MTVQGLGFTAVGMTEEAMINLGFASFDVEPSFSDDDVEDTDTEVRVRDRKDSIRRSVKCDNKNWGPSSNAGRSWKDYRKQQYRAA